MGIILYDKPSSSCCRAVKLTLEALDVKYESHFLNITKKENLSQYYLKMNPEHTYPVLDDNGLIIVDSHVINMYLVSVYGKDDSLYPLCPKKRAIVNHRLFFDACVLFPCEKRIFRTIIKERKKEADPKEINTTRDGYGILEQLLATSGTKYIAGDNITLADFSMIPTLCNLSVLVPEINEEKYPFIVAYMKRCEQTIIQYDKINGKGHEAFLKLFDGYM